MPASPEAAPHDQASPQTSAIDLEHPPEDWSQDDVDKYWLEHVYKPDERQLTVRALIVGCLLGGIMSVANLYVGLKVGWSLGMAITSTILAFVIFKGLRSAGIVRDELTMLENNTVASAGSAASYYCSAGMVSAIPALFITQQRQLSFVELALWMSAISFIGIVMAVPMRRQMIDVDRLKFPSGVACAETIRSMHQTAGEAVSKARALLAGTVAAAILELPLQIQKIGKWVSPLVWKDQYALPFTLAGKQLGWYTLSFNTSLLMYAAGAIMGIRVGLSLLAGALIIYGGLAPWLASHGVVIIQAEGNQTFRSVMAWAVWPGVLMTVVASLLQFALKWRSVVQALGSLGKLWGSNVQPSRMAAVEVPSSWFLWGISLSTIFVTTCARVIFGIPIWMGVLAVALSFVLSIVACRATGETDVTPIGPLGKITQLVYAGISPGNYHTNLMTASITAGATAHSADLLTDLKTGYLLGGAPKRQFVAQFVGILAGAIFCVPAYMLLVTPDTLGSAKFPAPAAQTWAVFADLLAHGVSNVDRGAAEAAPAQIQALTLSSRPAGLVLGDQVTFTAGPNSGAAYTLSAIYGKVVLLDRDLAVPAGWAVEAQGDDPRPYAVEIKSATGEIRGQAPIRLAKVGPQPALLFTAVPRGTDVSDYVRAEVNGTDIYQRIRGFRGNVAMLDHPFLVTDRSRSAAPLSSAVHVDVQKLALPPYAMVATVISILFGIAITLLEMYGPKGWRPYLPSITGLGIAAVIAGWDSIAMAIGAMIAWVFSKTHPKEQERYSVPLASGIIAGASVIGVFVAVLFIAKLVNQ